MWDSGSPRALGTRLGTFDSCHPDHFNNEVFMKKQKLFRPRIPWWSWDYGYDLPPDKGENKRQGNRIARAIGKRFTRKQYLDGE